MTTTEPSLAQEIYAAAKPQGVSSIDAPVSGGDVGAREARLSIMVGGDADAVEAVMPLFDAMGQNIVHQGGAGAGQHTKMCNQITIAGTMVGVCEALLYGYKAGLDLEVMLSSISGGAAACWSLDNLAPRILQRNFDPGFFVEHFIKDRGIALDEAKKMNLSLPGLALAHQLYLAVQAQGHGAFRDSGTDVGSGADVEHRTELVYQYAAHTQENQMARQLRMVRPDLDGLPQLGHSRGV